jgi:hypothetical protein
MENSDVKVVGLANNQPKGKTNWKVVGALIGIIVLALGVIAGIFLVGQQQDIREKASENNQCLEQCPGSDGVLRNCHPPESSGNSEDSICNAAFRGTVRFCGVRNYCCNGSAWTANMSACATPTATATSTSTATATGTSIATSTSTSRASATATSRSTSTSRATATSRSTATARSSATAFPVPETGTEWPTMIGAGFGVIMILVSLGLAL